MVQPFKCRRNLVFQLLNEAHILTFYGILFSSLGQDSVAKAKCMKDLIAVIASCLMVNAGFNLVELGVSLVKWIRTKWRNKAKVRPAIDIETGDVIKIAGSKGQDDSENKIIGCS